MTVLSWNINGLRAIVRKNFLAFLGQKKPDVLCLQEIKIDREAIKLADFDFPGYREFYNPAERKGYSGTAVLLREGLPAELLPKLKWDNEGRIQALDLGRYYLANIYFPNANHELSRLDFKINEFNDKLLRYLKKLDQDKPLVVCGDYNVAHQEIDLARPKENEGNPGFHPRERAWMSKFLRAGFVDTFRARNPGKVQYSWWSFRANARARNVGWRIDYVCVSRRILDQVKNAFIQDQVPGSDHAPVGVVIE